jgi:hypothetical protein
MELKYEKLQDIKDIPTEKTEAPKENVSQKIDNPTPKFNEVFDKFSKCISNEIDKYIEVKSRDNLIFKVAEHIISRSEVVKQGMENCKYEQGENGYVYISASGKDVNNLLSYLESQTYIANNTLIRLLFALKIDIKNNTEIVTTFINNSKKLVCYDDRFKEYRFGYQIPSSWDKYLQKIFILTIMEKEKCNAYEVDDIKHRITFYKNIKELVELTFGEKNPLQLECIKTNNPQLYPTGVSKNGVYESVILPFEIPYTLLMTIIPTLPQYNNWSHFEVEGLMLRIKHKS